MTILGALGLLLIVLVIFGATRGGGRGMYAWEMRGQSREEWMKEVSEKAKKFGAWFDANARCPKCGCGTENATEVSVGGGGRQWLCKTDGEALTVVLNYP